MTTQEVKRKLAVILSADAGRYSCLTGAVERERVSGPKMLNPCLFHCSLIKEKRLRNVCRPDPGMVSIPICESAGLLWGIRKAMEVQR
jgi:hypothetical protein